MTKICSKCKIEKPLDDFYMRTDRKTPKSRCKECLAEDAKRPEIQERIKETQKRSDLKRKNQIAEYRKEHYIKNKERIDGQNNEWRLNNKDRNRNSHYLRTYGITLEQYNELLEKQNHSCGVCKKHRDLFKVNFAVDHNHVTGKIRGLLCAYCNHRVVGRHKEGILLRAAADYIDAEGTEWVVPPKKKKKKRKK